MVAAARSSGRLLFFAIGCAVGGAAGFVGGVASVGAARDAFTSAFQDERAADVGQPQIIDRAAFRLQYPRNWKIDTTAADHDPDRMFSIDSPGTSFVMFVVATGALEPQAAVDAHVKAQTAKVMRDATRAPFDHWGAYPGAGVLLTGKKLGMTPGTIRVFAFRVGEETFTVIESTSDDDRSKVAPGFALIERTFQAKGAR